MHYKMVGYVFIPVNNFDLLDGKGIVEYESFKLISVSICGIILSINCNGPGLWITGFDRRNQKFDA